MPFGGGRFGIGKGASAALVFFPRRRPMTFTSS
jgi:hypothetical protein